MINKIQQSLLEELEKSFDNPHFKPLQKLALIPGSTSPHERLKIGLYARPVLLLSSAIVLTILLGLVIYYFYLWSDHNALAYLLRQWRVELPLAFATIRWYLLVLFSVVPVSAFCWIAVLSPWVWAWNRRADRLGREAPLPQAAPIVLPGVWPPPPTRS